MPYKVVLTFESVDESYRAVLLCHCLLCWNWNRSLLMKLYLSVTRKGDFFCHYWHCIGHYGCDRLGNHNLVFRESKSGFCLTEILPRNEFQLTDPHTKSELWILHTMEIWQIQILKAKSGHPSRKNTDRWLHEQWGSTVVCLCDKRFFPGSLFFPPSKESETLGTEVVVS